MSIDTHKLKRGEWGQCSLILWMNSVNSVGWLPGPSQILPHICHWTLMPRHSSVTRNKWQAWIYTVAAKLMMSHFKWECLVDNGVFGKWEKSLQSLSANSHSPILFTFRTIIPTRSWFSYDLHWGEKKKDVNGRDTAFFDFSRMGKPQLPLRERHASFERSHSSMPWMDFHEESMSKELHHAVRPDPAVLYAKSTWKGI